MGNHTFVKDKDPIVQRTEGLAPWYHLCSPRPCGQLPLGSIAKRVQPMLDNGSDRSVLLVTYSGGPSAGTSHGTYGTLQRDVLPTARRSYSLQSIPRTLHLGVRSLLSDFEVTLSSSAPTSSIVTYCSTDAIRPPARDKLEPYSRCHTHNACDRSTTSTESDAATPDLPEQPDLPAPSAPLPPQSHPRYRDRSSSSIP